MHRKILIIFIIFNVINIGKLCYGKSDKLILADFDTGTVNNLGKQFSVNAKSPSTLVATFDNQNTYSGAGRSLKLVYSKQADDKYWIAWWTQLKLDVREYDTLSFWIRGENGEEIFTLTLSGEKSQSAKLMMGDFMPEGVSTNWTKVRIPLKEFLEFSPINPQNIETLVIGFPELGDGVLYIDDITLEKGLLKKEYELNGFEDENPNIRYYLKLYGSSDAKLDSSKQAKYDQNALKFTYDFKSYNSYQSRAGIVDKFKDPVNFSQVENVHIWIRGDGSKNAFYFNIIDTSGSVYTYIDRDILFHHEWEKLSVPITKFKNEKGEILKNKSQIESVEMGVVSASRSSQKGTILFDGLTVSGADLKPFKKEEKDVPQLRDYLQWHSIKFLKEVRSETEFWDTKAKGFRIFQNFILRTDFTFQNFNFQGDLVVYGRLRPFYQSSHLDENDDEKEVRSKDYDVVARDLRLNILDVAKGVERITLGNIRINYNKYTVVGQNQYEGLEIQGAMDDLNYHSFLMKLWNNSYSVGGKGEFEVWGLTTKVIGIQNMAHARSYQSVDEVKTTRLFKNTMYNLTLKKTFSRKFSMNAFFGANKWTFYGTTAVTTNQTGFRDETIPEFGRLFVTPITYDEQGMTAGYESAEFPWSGLVSRFNYTYFSDYFALSPYTKESGDSFQGDFDDFLIGRKYMPMDGVGFNGLIAQYIWFFRLSGEWFRYRLMSDKNRTKWEQYYSIGRSNIGGVTLTFTYGIRELEYWFLVPKEGEPGFIPDGYVSDMYWVVAEYFLSNRGHILVKYNYNDIVEKYDTPNGSVDAPYTAEIYSALFSYYVAINARLEFEYKYTHPKEYSVKYGYWPPENFTALRLHVSF